MRISDWSSDVCSSDLLHIRGSNNPGAAVDQAIDSVYARHGTCEMRSVMNELSEACDREYHEVMAAEVFDGSFDWEWCHNWLRTDRKRGGWGTSVAERVDLGGSRIVK